MTSSSPSTATIYADPLWNLLDSTDDGYADQEYAAKLERSGVAAINHTVGATGDMHATMRSISTWLRFYEDTPNVFRALTSADAYRAAEEGKTAVFMGFQGIDPLDGNLDMLEVYWALGVRFIQPTYQRRSLAGEGCGEPTADSVGLSDFGRKLVDICNDLGMVLDISHVGKRTSMEIIERSTRPVMASHSAAGGLVECVRNKSDEEIRGLAAGGGVIGIAGKSMFLNSQYETEGSTLEHYLRHIEYVIDLVGEDHVAIGTDISDERRYTSNMLRGFRRAYPELPLGGQSDCADLANTKDIPSPADLPKIITALEGRGMSTETINKIRGANAQRVCAANF